MEYCSFSSVTHKTSGRSRLACSCPRNSRATTTTTTIGVTMVWLATMLLVTLPDVHSWTTTTTILPQPQQQQLLQTSTSYDRRRISLIALRASSTAPPPTTLDGMEIPNPIECVGDVIVVKVRDTLTATGGGILLPDQSQERPTEGLVLATGPGRIHPRTAVRIPNPIAEGMSVVYGKFDGKPVEYKGEECQIIRDDNVLLAYNGLTLRLDNVECIRDAVLIALFDEEVVEKENDDVETNTPDNDKQQQSKQQKSPGIATTSSGVVIAASVLKDDLPCQGRVVRVGPGRVSCTTGLSTPGPVQAGDRVKFKEYAGNDIFIQGKPYTVVKMVDILATILPEAADW